MNLFPYRNLAGIDWLKRLEEQKDKTNNKNKHFVEYWQAMDAPQKIVRILLANNLLY